MIPIIHALIREYPDTISLGQGVVYYGPPPQTEEALRGFWEVPGNHLYGAVWGIPPLRELLRAKLQAENGIRLDDERQLVVSAGGNMAFVNALLAIADPGDEIILISPYYFNHEMAVAMANCRPVIVPADAAYQLDLDAIAGAITSRTPRGGVDLAQQPYRRGLPGSRPAGAERAVRGGAASTTSTTRPTSTSPTTGARTSRPARCRRPRDTPSPCSRSPRATASPAGGSAT